MCKFNIFLRLTFLRMRPILEDGLDLYSHIVANVWNRLYSKTQSYDAASLVCPTASSLIIESKLVEVGIVRVRPATLAHRWSTIFFCIIIMCNWIKLLYDRMFHWSLKSHYLSFTHWYHILRIQSDDWNLVLVQIIDNIKDKNNRQYRKLLFSIL